MNALLIEKKISQENFVLGFFTRRIRLNVTPANKKMKCDNIKKDWSTEISILENWPCPWRLILVSQKRQTLSFWEEG